MIEHHNNKTSNNKTSKRGRGILNTLIDKLPIELHLPGYNFCGPGTKLKKRLERGDTGINPLDEACKEHDIYYSQHHNKIERHKADKILAEKAWQRVKSKDAKFGERASAWLVTNAMKVKTKMGMGIKGKLRTKCNLIKKSKIFQKAVKNARKVLKEKSPSNVLSAVKLALKAAKKVFKNKKSKVQIPRIIPIPKTGGILPFLVPLFAGLSAVGALTGGAAKIAKVVNEAKNAREQLVENQRHNKTMESIAMGKGLYLKPYNKGFGLHLKPYPKNF